MENSAHLAFIKLDKENDVVIVDPYMVNIEELRNCGIKNIVRVRRPGWGIGIGVVVCSIEGLNIVDIKDLLTELKAESIDECSGN